MPPAEQLALPPGAARSRAGAPTVGEPKRTAASDARALTIANFVGAALNLPKFALVIAVLGPGELDVLAVGLLVATTLAQVAGEAIANHAATAVRGGRPDGADLFSGLLIAAFALAALVPDVVVAVLAPGLEDAAADHDVALRLLCLAGATTVALWWVAGERQRGLDLRGLALVNIVPNLAIVAGLLVPAADRLVAVGLAMAITPAVCALLLLPRRLRTPPRREILARAPRLCLPAGLLTLLMLGVASQSNLVAVRFVGSGLDEGAIAAVYVAVGAALLPAWTVAAGLTGALLPRWQQGLAAGRLANPLIVALLSGVLCAVLVGPALVALPLVGEAAGEWAGVDERLLASLQIALPILLTIAPFASAAWVLRGWMVAEGRALTAAGLALTGVALLPVPVALSPTLAALCVGYGLTMLPLLVGVPLITRRARRRAGS